MKPSSLMEQTLFVILPSVSTAAARKKLLLLSRWAPLFEEAGVRLVALAPDPHILLQQESLFLHLSFPLISDPFQECASHFGCLQTRMVFGTEQKVCVASLVLCSETSKEPSLILRHVLPESLLRILMKAQKLRWISLEKCALALVDNPYSCC